MENKEKKVTIGECRFKMTTDCTHLSTTVKMPDNMIPAFYQALTSDTHDTGLVFDNDNIDIIGNGHLRKIGISMSFVPTDNVKELVDFSRMFSEAIKLMLDKAIIILAQFDLQASINKRLDGLMLDVERVKHKSTSVESVVMSNTKNNNITEDQDDTLEN